MKPRGNFGIAIVFVFLSARKGQLLRRQGPCFRGHASLWLSFSLAASLLIGIGFADWIKVGQTQVDGEGSFGVSADGEAVQSSDFLTLGSHQVFSYCETSFLDANREEIEETAFSFAFQIDKEELVSAFPTVTRFLFTAKVELIYSSGVSHVCLLLTSDCFRTASLKTNGSQVFSESIETDYYDSYTLEYNWPKTSLPSSSSLCEVLLSFSTTNFETANFYTGIYSYLNGKVSLRYSINLGVLA